ncbi:MAG: replication initiator protein A [Lachnospiraceae bacterium]|nr:replication initiator protein A [Lachnospiraceae bacterium]
MAKQNIRLDYFYGIQSEMFTFLRIPKILIEDGRFEKLSNDAKLLFGLLLDRMSLSMSNKWFDDKNRVYIVYSTDNIMIDLCIESEKCTKLLKELENFGLIERIRGGVLQKDIIYVKNFAKLVNDGEKMPKEKERIIKERRVRDRERRKEKRAAERRKKEEAREFNIESDNPDVDDTGECDFDNQMTGNSEIEGTQFRKSNDKLFENQMTDISEIECQVFRESNPNNTNINNTDYNNTNINDTDNNIDIYNDSLTHSVCFEESGKVELKQGESEGDEIDNIYKYINKALDCQKSIIERTKQIQAFHRGEAQMPKPDLTTAAEHKGILDNLTYELFLKSRDKYKWSQIKTIEMAAQVLNIKLEGKVLKETGVFMYYEDEMFDTLVDYMAEIIGLNEKITISGTVYTAEYMGMKFFDLNRELILHVIETLRTTGGNITNKKNYYVSCLLNAKTHYSSELYSVIKTIK